MNHCTGADRSAGAADRGRIGLLAQVGQSALVSADTTHRLTKPLTELLTATYGLVPVMTDLLAGVAGVERAYIYGSWAARQAGRPGPVPVDLDVLVVGSADLDDLDDIARTARELLGFEVNIQRVGADSWSLPGDDRFLAHVRDKPLVELAVGCDRQVAVGTSR